jgi:ribosomal protein S18 acetylase RimI-like enzyme
MNGDPSLRPGVPGDLDRLTEIFVAAFQAGYPNVLPADVLAGVTVATVREWFSRWAETDGLITWVAEVDGVPVGFVRFGAEPAETTRDAAEPIGYVAALYVHPDAAGRGVGRTLLDAAVERLAGDRCSAVTLWVFKVNVRARRLYSAAGFVPDGTELTDPQWKVPQVCMRKRVRSPET